jgi:hypothetical protein
MVPTSAPATRAALPATAGPRVAAATAATPRPSARRGQAGVARQVKDQRRGYARAVLQSLGRTYRGRPAAGVIPILRQALAPLGVRLSPVQLRELARHIEAGHPVELP